MPALFDVNSYDLAGYCVGVVNHGSELPTNDITDGDIVLGLPSNGLHCAGYHLIYDLMSKLNETYENVAPFSKTRSTFGNLKVKKNFFRFFGNRIFMVRCS